MRRLLLLLFLVASWTAAEAWEKKRLALKAEREWIPARNYTDDRSKAKAGGCDGCLKVATSLRVKDTAANGRGNGTMAQGPNVVRVVHKVTAAHFARDLPTTDSQRAKDTLLRAKGHTKITAKNLIPSYKVDTPHVLRKPCKDAKIKILEDNDAMPPTEAQRINGPARQHKAFFVNYPSSQRVYQGKDAKQVVASPGKKQKPKQKPGKHKPDSDIYFIRLPPTPYSYVPGLGYISQPAKFSTSALAGADKRPPPQLRPKPQSPFIKLPLEFVSNGKPTAVYRWSSSTTAKVHHHQQQQHHHQQQQQQQQQQQLNRGPPAKEDSIVYTLNRGPYVFNGKPTSIYLKRKNSRPVAPNLI